MQKSVFTKRCFAAVTVGLVLSLTQGCDDASEKVLHKASASSSHPDPGFVDESIRPTWFRFSDKPGSFAVRPSSGITATFGQEDGEEEFVFGRLTDLGLTSEGNVVVLDGSVGEVRLFDSTGALLERFGREGRGPVEFRDATSIAIGPRDELAVFDLTRRLQLFKPGPSGYQLVRSFQIGLSIRSMCFMRDGLAVSGTSSGGPHVLAMVDLLSGQTMRTFGEIYSSPNLLANQIVSEGRIACDFDNDVIYFATRSVIGEVRAFGSDGTQLWRTAIRDFKANDISDGPDGYSVRRSPDGIHALHALTFMRGVGLIGQYSFRSSEELAERVGAKATYTVLFEASTGKPTISESPWPLIGATKESRLVTFVESPFPRVDVLSWEPYELRPDP